MATADSNVKSKIWTKRSLETINIPEAAVWLPNRVRRRWPAIILAERRMASVPGRITFLTVSMTTIKDIKAGGVPWGTKWANIYLV
jgi:hypothetical protein